MTKARWWAISVAFSLAVAAAAPAKPALYTSRVPYPPLLEKLKAGGGDLARVVHVERAADLGALEAGRRYKFVVDERGKMAIAPLPADAPSNEYVHPILAGGGPVRTAGGIRVDRADGKVSGVTIDQDSKSYCPSFDSLSAAVAAIASLGIAPAAIHREDKAPQCVAP